MVVKQEWGHMEAEMVEGVDTMSAPQERKQVIAERLIEAGFYSAPNRAACDVSVHVFGHLSRAHLPRHLHLRRHLGRGSSINRRRLAYLNRRLCLHRLQRSEKFSSTPHCLHRTLAGSYHRNQVGLNGQVAV